ncbi:MAG: hypothetical protein ACTSVD_10025, partial [Candidatus Thorarchaeota archaeon]
GPGVPAPSPCDGGFVLAGGVWRDVQKTKRDVYLFKLVDTSRIRTHGTSSLIRLVAVILIVSLFALSILLRFRGRA